MWFFYFSRVTQDARHRTHRPYRKSSPAQNVSGFADIATFFGICVWLVPLFLFLSLSANDNALPMNAGTGLVTRTPFISLMLWEIQDKAVCHRRLQHLPGH